MDQKKYKDAVSRYGPVNEYELWKDLGGGKYEDPLGKEFACRQCLEGKNYKKGHELFCRNSRYYGKTWEEIKRQKEVSEEMKNQRKDPPKRPAKSSLV